MRRRRWLQAALGGLGAAAASCRDEVRRKGTRVVLVTLDTLRKDALFGRDGDPPGMPRLWRRAGRGVVFERYFSASSSTQPTHATLLTGLHPWEHGVPRNGAVLQAGSLTVAEQLRSEGFRTAAVVAAFPLHHRFGFGQGFETYVDDFSEDQRRRWEGTRLRGAGFRSSGEHVTRRALELLEKTEGARQFFWFHYFDAHAPYGGSTGADPTLDARDVLERIGHDSPDAQTVLARARGLYDQDVDYLDETLERLLSRLDRDRARFDTHVLVVADHGESFGEAGSLGHGKRLTREQVEVPCLLFSERAAPGKRSAPVGTVDLSATLLSLAGVDPALAGGRDLLDPASSPRPVVGMRRTFRHPFEEKRLDGTVAVHDSPRFYLLDGADLITGDPRRVTLEDTDRPLGDPGRAARARRLFAGFEAVLERRSPRELVDEDTARGLRALGYAP